MFLNYANAIVDVDSYGGWYLIFLDNGFKYNYSQYCEGGRAFGCSDTIGDSDVLRAKEKDKVDISHLMNKSFTEEQIKENIQRAKNFLESKEYPFKKVKIALTK